MEFDWRRAIERNSEALCAIAARLIVMAGIQAGRIVPALPRHLYLRILSLLRPAEYAARRVILMAACTLDLEVEPVRPRGAAPAVRRREPSAGKAAALPAFALFDPFKRAGHPWLEGIAAHDGGDSFNGDSHDGDPWPALPPDEPVDAENLCRRIRALAEALSDLDGQALRLARWRARRHLESGKPGRLSPLRPGRPPGCRKRPKTPVEEVLKECHFLARNAWNTS